MNNPFKQQKGYTPKPNRNNFDLSYQNHLTLPMGMEIPFYLQECVPGDSFEISSKIGLKFQPMTFPVQTRMMASVSYFWVPTRILWPDFKDWITGQRPELVHPYIKQRKEFFATGSLADYLGVPTSVIAGSHTVLPFDSLYVNGSTILEQQNVTGVLSRISPTTIIPLLYALYDAPAEAGYFGRFYLVPSINSRSTWFGPHIDHKYYGTLCELTELPTSLDFTISDSRLNPSVLAGGMKFFMAITEGRDMSYPLGRAVGHEVAPGVWHDIQNTFDFLRTSHNEHQYIGDVVFDDESQKFRITPSETYNYFLDEARNGLANGKRVFVGLFFNVTDLEKQNIPHSMSNFNGASLDSFPSAYYFDVDVLSSFDSSRTGTPFASDGGIRLNALPFRAYEACHNAYFRNSTVDPFKVGGRNEYNRFVTNDQGGADDTPYALFNHDWQLDGFTSCLPSPQQGSAPLIGMSNLDTMQITDENGTPFNYRVTTADDGQTIVQLSALNPNASIGSQRVAMNIARAGITVNDIRNVNSLQRWLETNIRRGYHYMDFMTGHHGVTPSHADLQMPEFLGGYTRDVQVGTVMNMAAGETVLGQTAGTANLFTGSSHKIHKFCDDYGYIIGIMTVYPEPVYSQNLRKDFLKSQVLDYYFPEFANLGMQPVTYEELTPIQRWLERNSGEQVSLQDTFGYQRPNYDMIYRADEAHGDFRGNLSNYLIHRIFSHSPELGADFIHMTPADCQQVFTVQDEPPVIGQIINEVYAKRPVPRVVIPKLE